MGVIFRSFDLATVVIGRGYDFPSDTATSPASPALATINARLAARAPAAGGEADRVEEETG